MTRVLIADDHPLVRFALKTLLQQELRAVMCGEAQSAPVVLTELQQRRWDLLILDLAMPGRGGIDLLGELRQPRTNTRILVYSVYPAEHFGRRALRSGAHGYVNKGAPVEELLQAIHKVLAGGFYISPLLAERFAADFAQDARASALDGLSNREFEILRAMASGQSVSQIAEELHLAITTVSTYRARVLKKTNIASTGELIRYALANRLVE